MSPLSSAPVGATMPVGAAMTNTAIGQVAATPDTVLPQLDPVGGNRVNLLVDQEQVLPEMLEAVRQARTSVDFSMFSLADSGAGREMIDLLVDRARNGVDVRVMLDQVGSSVLPFGGANEMVDRMRAAGIDVAVNERFEGGLQPVDHRKLLVVDQQTAFTGGMNFSKKFGAWHDVMVRTDGPAAARFGAHFVDRWVDVTGTSTHLAMPPDAPRAAIDDARGAVGLLVNHPNHSLQASTHLLQNITEATDRAWILTPTLSDPAVVDALAAAARRGVDVRVAVSGPEGWIGTRALRVIGSTFYPDLLEAGVQVYEQPGMSHAKVSLVDDVASAGSLNMTRRAMLWDHELMLVSDDAHFVGQVEDLFTTDFARSTKVGEHVLDSPLVKLGAAFRRVSGLKW